MKLTTKQVDALQTYANIALCPYCGMPITFKKAHDVRKLASTPRHKKLCHSKCLDEARAKWKRRARRNESERLLEADKEVIERLKRRLREE